MALEFTLLVDEPGFPPWQAFVIWQVDGYVVMRGNTSATWRTVTPYDMTTWFECNAGITTQQGSGCVHNGDLYHWGGLSSSSLRKSTNKGDSFAAISTGPGDVIASSFIRDHIGNMRCDAMASFGGYLWIIGGLRNVGAAGFRNGVIRSVDGHFWEIVLPWTTPASTPADMFQPFEYGQLVVLNSRMYLLGIENAADQERWVWSSTDGATWTPLTTSAPWPLNQTSGYKAAVLGGRIYVLVNNDVWSSSDGITWTSENAVAPFGTQFNGGWIAINGALHYVAGTVDGVTSNDIYKSQVVVPLRAAVFPAASARTSHVRIMRGHRNPQQAQDFHEVMRVGA